MTDAIFSFGVEGLESLAQVEAALQSLARTSERFQAFSDLKIAPPVDTEGVTRARGELEALVGLMQEARTEAESSGELLKIDSSIASIKAAIGGLEGLTRGFTEAEASGMQMKQFISNWNTEMKEAATSSKEFSTALKEQMEAEAAVAAESEKLASLQMAQYIKDWDTATREATQTNKEFTASIKERMQAEVDGANAAIAAQKRQQEYGTFSGGLARGLHGQGATLSSSLGYHLGSQLEYMPGMAVQGALFAAPYEAIKQIKEYSSGQADLNLALRAQPGGQSASGDYLNSLADVSRAVGENAQQSFDSASQGIRIYNEEIRKSGDTTGKVAQQIGLATAQASAQLGVLTGEGQQKATAQLLSIASSFGLGPSDLGQVNDAIAYTRANVGGNAAQISAGLQGFSKGAAFAGMNVNETAVLMGLLQARTGDDGGALANRVNRIFQNVSGTKGDALAAQYASSPNATKEDAAILRNANATGLQRLGALADVFASSNQQVQNRMATQLGGPQAGTEAKAILEEYLTTIKPNFERVDSGKAAGAADQQFATLIDTVGIKIKQLGADLSNLVNDLARSDIAAPIGALVAGLGPLINAVDAGVREFDNLPDGVKKAIMGLTELGAALAIYRKLSTAREAAKSESQAAYIAALNENTAALRGNTIAEEENTTSGKGIGGLKGALPFALGGALSIGGQYVGGNAGTVMTDAGTGAMLGSMIGPEGALIGGLLGGGLGLLQTEQATKQQQSQIDAANASAVQQTNAAASQAIAAGNFAAAVQAFRNGVNDLKTGGSGGGTNTGTQATLDTRDANLITGNTGGLSRYINDLAAPISASASKGDQIIAGEQYLAHKAKLQALIDHPRQPTAGDLVDVITGDIADPSSAAHQYGVTNFYPAVNPGDAPKGAGYNYTGDGYNTVGTRTLDGAAIAARVKAVVTDFIKKNGTAHLTDAQLTALLKEALDGAKATTGTQPGGSSDAIHGASPAVINAILPDLKALITTGGDGLTQALNAMTELNNAGGAAMLKTLEATRAAAIDHAKSSNWIRSAAGLANARQMIDAAGNDPALIREALGNLDKATITQVENGIRDEQQAAASYLAMHQDLVNALAAAQAVSSSVSALSSALTGPMAGLLAATQVAAALGGQGGDVATVLKDQHTVAAASAQLANIHSQLPTVTPSTAGIPKSGGGGGAGHQYDYVKSAVAEAKAARLGGGDVAAAQAALLSAQDQLDHNKVGSAAWWRADAALWQAKKQLAQAEAANAQQNFMLTHDATDPVMQALGKARAALEQYRLDKKLGFGKEVQGKDLLAYRDANAQLAKTKEDQVLQQWQTQEQLGLKSHAAYIAFLEQQKNLMESMKNKTYDQTQYMYQIDQALKAANDSTNAMWNLGDINTNGLVAQVSAIGQLVKQVNNLGSFNYGVHAAPKVEVAVHVSAPAGHKVTTHHKTTKTHTTRNPRP